MGTPARRMPEWKTGLCDCCSTPGCCMGWCCPCCLFGQIVGALPADSGVMCAGNCCGACFGCAALDAIPYVGFILSAIVCLGPTRGKIREMNGIEGSCMND